MSRPHRLAPALFAVALWAAAPGAAVSQTVLERTPNVEGIWAPSPVALQFNFMHRFFVTDPPTRKLVASPSFLVAVGGPARTSVGARYAPNSPVVRGEVNEWELFARWVALRQRAGAPVDLGLQVSHNVHAGGVDGEVLAARDVGRLRLLAGARAFSSYAAGDGQVGVVGGARARLTRHVAVGLDRVELPGADGPSAWSAGLLLEIPYTPHSLSLHVSNAHTTTLQGSSLGQRDRRWGFEFTAPLTWGRFGAARARPAPPVDEDPAAAVVDMDNTMDFQPATVRIRVGERVVWRNRGDIIHTVTAVPGRGVDPANVSLPDGAEPFDSGDLRPGEEFVHTFAVPGVYRYICVPHEMAGMVGVVIVEG